MAAKRKPTSSSPLPNTSAFVDAFKSISKDMTVGELLRDKQAVAVIFASLFDMMKEALAVVASDKITKKPKLESIEASSLKDLDRVISMFRLDHVEGDKAYFFKLKNPRKIERPAYLEDTLLRMRRARNKWYLQSAEALCRTMIDLPMFEMLEKRDQQLARRRFGLKAEKRVIAVLPDKKTQVTGDADYVCGYPSANEKDTGFESTMVVVEAKKKNTFPCGVPLCVAYLVGLQQNRYRLEPQRMNTAVYGIVSDGTQYIFLRLEERLLLVSKTYTIVDDDEADIIFNFLDEILDSAIASSLHTTPSKTFPATSSQWREEMEQQRWTLPSDYDFTERTPDNEFMEAGMDGGSSDDDMADLKGFEILNFDDSPSPLLRSLPKEDRTAGSSMEEDY